MNLRSPLLLLALAWLLPGQVSAQQNRPNFVFILADDLGVMDVSAYNPDTFYETPNLNRLAMDGMRFTNGYAANPVCSPTRFSIMTGRYPSRVDSTDWFTGRRTGTDAPAELNDRIPRSEVTVAEALKGAGYRTAFLGKWHLGPTEEYWPLARGFDINVGGHDRGSPRSYFSPYGNPELRDGPDGEYLTDRLIDEALGILETFEDDPFLLFLSFYTVHTPLQAQGALIEKYERKAARLPDLVDAAAEFADEEQVWPVDDVRRVRTRQSHATYAAMVEAMDSQIGRLLAKLTELGLEDDTVVFFTSDNGEVAGVRLAARAWRAADFEPAAEERQAVTVRRRPADVSKDSAQALESISCHDRRLDMAQRIESRACRNVVPGTSRSGVIGKGGGHRNQGDAPFSRIKEFCLTSLGQTGADTSGDDAGVVDVSRTRQHGTRPVVAGMIVGQRTEVETSPHEFVDQRRRRPHVGASALMHGRILEVVEQHLDVRERRISSTDQLDHAQERQLLVNRKPAGDDRVAGQRHPERRCIGRLLGARRQE